MLRKSKLLVSLFALLLLTLLSVQTAFAATNATLKTGMEGTAVTELQKDLKTLGFMSVNPTGYFGDITKSAVTQFQKKYGLLADGIAGTKTLGKIDSLQGAATTVSRGTSQQTTQNVELKTGMEGAAVNELQKDLKTLEFMSSNPTGYFGSITKDAVIRFQQAYGLTADGIAGAKTLSKIESLNGVNTTTSRGTSERTSQSVIDYAKKLLGIRYRWGGTTTKGFDCSGFTRYVFNKIGITLNRTSTAQASNGTYIKKANLLPGDLVLFDTNGGLNRINHVGIYIGSGKFIHSSSSNSGVTISDITGGFYSKSYMTARRVLK